MHVRDRKELRGKGKVCGCVGEPDDLRCGPLRMPVLRMLGMSGAPLWDAHAALAGTTEQCVDAMRAALNAYLISYREIGAIASGAIFAAADHARRRTFHSGAPNELARERMPSRICMVNTHGPCPVNMSSACGCLWLQDGKGVRRRRRRPQACRVPHDFTRMESLAMSLSQGYFMA